MVRVDGLTIHYPNENGAVFVQQLGLDELTESTAVAMQGVLQASYSHHFEEPNGPLPTGTIKRYCFNPDDPTKVAVFLGHIQIALQSGENYWLVRTEDNSAQLVGFAQTADYHVSPLSKTGCYICEVVVEPEHQGQGYASRLLHAPLKFAYQPDQLAAVDIFKTTSPLILGWWDNLIGCTSEVNAGLVIDEEQHLILPRVRYVTREDIAIGGLVAALETGRYGKELKAAAALTQ